MRRTNQRIIVLFIHACTCAICSSVYDIEQGFYPLNLFWKCQGVSNLQTQRVKYIEEAAKAFYLAKISGRDMTDRILAEHLPPASILTHEHYSKMIIEVIKEPPDGLGSQLMMRQNCELFNNLDWVRDDYDRDLSRNTNGVRGILDVIYRMGLCVRGLDTHLNCPDVCRQRGSKFCARAEFSIGICGTYIPEELKTYNPAKEPAAVVTLSDDFKRWHAMIPRPNRLPLAFFKLFADNKELLANAFDAQVAAAKVPFCICEPFYTYDRVQETCVEDMADFACGGGNPCMNGGECQKAVQPDSDKKKEIDDDDDDDEDVKLFVCKCLPAFGGELCDVDVDLCATGDGVKTCKPFKCVRAPEDPYNGFKCKCPPRTHNPKSPLEPVCIPKPACKSGDSSTGPCRFGGRCEQDEKSGDPLDYRCICPPGFSGTNCEDPPPEPYWSTWGTWGLCNWPKPIEVCFKHAYQECTRECHVYAPGQVCQGPSRKVRYRVCDLNSDDDAVKNSITKETRETLQTSLSLCKLSAEVSPPGTTTSLKEDELNEPMSDPLALDDWLNVGPEEATRTLLPDVFRKLDRESLLAVNLPSLWDLVYLAIWFYSIVLLLGLVVAWISKLHVWILRYYHVEVES